MLEIIDSLLLLLVLKSLLIIESCFVCFVHQARLLRCPGFPRRGDGRWVLGGIVGTLEEGGLWRDVRDEIGLNGSVEVEGDVGLRLFLLPWPSPATSFRVAAFDGATGAC